MTAAPYVAKRIRRLPPYLFAEMDRVKADLLKRGTDVVDLSVGDPDLPSPPFVVEALREAAGKPANHRYPEYSGSRAFRKAASDWLAERFGAVVDPDTQVLALIGSKEGLSHAPLAFLDPDDVALVPDPGYPVYAAASSFAGAEPVAVPLRAEKRFLLDPQDIPKSSLGRARVLFLNYPNNPTSAVADRAYFDRIAAFAHEHGILILHDAAYSEVDLSGLDLPSFLSARGGKDVALEFHSLSKTFNMAGWRVGFAAGNAAAVGALAKVKTNVDSGVFGAVQEAAIAAMSNWRQVKEHNARIYARRRDLVCESLDAAGIRHFFPRATFFVWCEVPGRESSADFCTRLLRDTGVCVTPGSGFGSAGEGHFRISLTSSEIRLQEALSRMKRV